jgi:hypothetical protein
MDTASTSSRTRERLLAPALPLTAALYIGAEGLNPRGTDKVVTTAATAATVLPIAVAHPTQLFTSSTLAELALGAVAVSYAALATLVRGRGAALATIAAIIGGIGAFCGAIVNVFVGLNLAAAAKSHVATDAAGRVLIANFTSVPGQVFTDVYAATEFIAPVLMAIALWRSRDVPRWLVVLFAVGFELAEQTASVGVAEVVLLMAPFAIAAVLLSIRVWRRDQWSADNLDRDNLPGTSRVYRGDQTGELPWTLSTPISLHSCARMSDRCCGWPGC